MKTATRPQYHRLRRILEMIRKGTRTGSLPNCGHFTCELEVSRRTLMRDLDFLRDDENAPIAYDDSRKGFKLSDPTFILPPVHLTPREVFSFSIARKLLKRFEGTPLEMDTAQRNSAALQGARHRRRHPSFVPLRLGGTGQTMRLPGAVCARGVGTQQQGGASRLCAPGAGEAAVTGKLRETSGGWPHHSVAIGFARAAPTPGRARPGSPA